MLKPNKFEAFLTNPRPLKQKSGLPIDTLAQNLVSLSCLQDLVVLVKATRKDHDDTFKPIISHPRKLTDFASFKQLRYIYPKRYFFFSKFDEGIQID